MTRLAMLDGRGPDQIGVLVDDLEAALARYDALWGGGPWRCFRYAADTIPSVTYRGRPGEYSIWIALNQTVPQVELVHPISGPSIYEEWMERRGLGLHHLGFFVESLDETIASMDAAGYALLQSGAGYGLDGDGGYAYFDTERDFGVLLEAIEVPARRREPEFVFPPGPGPDEIRPLQPMVSGTADGPVGAGSHPALSGRCPTRPRSCRRRRRARSR